MRPSNRNKPTPSTLLMMFRLTCLHLNMPVRSCAPSKGPNETLTDHLAYPKLIVNGVLDETAPLAIHSQVKHNLGNRGTNCRETYADYASHSGITKTLLRCPFR